MPLGGKRLSKNEESRVRLSDIDTGRLLGLKYKLICSFKLAKYMVGGGIREFVNDADRPVVLEMPIYMF